MSISYIPEQESYKEMTPFKRFVLQSFPWINEDFDALTNYELMGKIIEYLNTVISNENIVENNVSNLYNSFVQLHDYVSNYFDNLDVQEEINNKLDDMAENGELAEIIAEYLNSNIQIHFPLLNNSGVGSFQASGNCAILQLKEKTGIIDFGFDTSGNDIGNYLILHNMRKIDFCIISHYHGDHVGGSNCEGLLNLLNNNAIDFSECTFYLPAELDSTQWLGDEISSIETRKALIINELETKEINYTTPTENSTLNVENGVTIRFLNVSDTFYDQYYDVTFQSNGSTNTGETNYNNFSMVVELKNVNNLFLFPGDIENKAQELIYPYLKNYNVYAIEHHGSNDTSYKKYMKVTKPKDYAIVQSNQLVNFDNEGEAYLNNTGVPIYGTEESGNIVVYSNGVLCTIESQNGAVIRATKINEFYKGSNIDGYSVAPDIKSGDDLNDYNVAGIYKSSGSAITNSLSNCPITGTGFKMYVEYINSTSFYRQTLIVNNKKDIFVRYKFTTDGTNYIYSKWYKDNVAYLDLPDNVLPSGDNLNNYTTPGTYYNTQSNISNSPVTVPFRLEVRYINSTSRIEQKLIPNNKINGTFNTYTRYFTVNTSTSQEEWTEWKKSNLNDIGNFLANNSDLNNITECGTFCCGSGSVAATLSNSPISNTGFRLEVKKISNNDTFRQIAYPNNSLNYYMRMRYSSGGSYIWSDWKTITVS